MKRISQKSVVISVVRDSDLGIICLSPELEQFLVKNPIFGPSDYTDLPGVENNVQSSWRQFSPAGRRPGSQPRVLSEEARRKQEEARQRRQIKMASLQRKREEVMLRRALKRSLQTHLKDNESESSLSQEVENEFDRGSSDLESPNIIISSPNKKQFNQNRSAVTKQSKVRRKMCLFEESKFTNSDKSKDNNRIDTVRASLKDRSKETSDVNLNHDVGCKETNSSNSDVVENSDYRHVAAEDLKASEGNGNQDFLGSGSNSSEVSKRAPLKTVLVKSSQKPNFKNRYERDETWSVDSERDWNWKVNKHSSPKTNKHSSPKKQRTKRKERVNYAEMEDGDMVEEDFHFTPSSSTKSGRKVIPVSRKLEEAVVTASMTKSGKKRKKDPASEDATQSADSGVNSVPSFDEAQRAVTDKLLNSNTEVSTREDSSGKNMSNSENSVKLMNNVAEVGSSIGSSIVKNIAIPSSSQNTSDKTVAAQKIEGNSNSSSRTSLPPSSLLHPPLAHHTSQHHTAALLVKQQQPPLQNSQTMQKPLSSHHPQQSLSGYHHPSLSHPPPPPFHPPSTLHFLHPPTTTTSTPLPASLSVSSPLSSSSTLHVMSPLPSFSQNLHQKQLQQQERYGNITSAFSMSQAALGAASHINAQPSQIPSNSMSSATSSSSSSIIPLHSVFESCYPPPSPYNKTQFPIPRYPVSLPAYPQNLPTATVTATTIPINIPTPSTLQPPNLYNSQDPRYRLSGFTSHHLSQGQFSSIKSPSNATSNNTQTFTINLNNVAQKTSSSSIAATGRPKNSSQASHKPPGKTSAFSILTSLYPMPSNPIMTSHQNVNASPSSRKVSAKTAAPPAVAHVKNSIPIDDTIQKNVSKKVQPHNKLVNVSEDIVPSVVQHQNTSSSTTVAASCKRSSMLEVENMLNDLQHKGKENPKSSSESSAPQPQAPSSEANSKAQSVMTVEAMLNNIKSAYQNKLKAKETSTSSQSQAGKASVIKNQSNDSKNGNKASRANIQSESCLSYESRQPPPISSFSHSSNVTSQHYPVSDHHLAQNAQELRSATNNRSKSETTPSAEPNKFLRQAFMQHMINPNPQFPSESLSKSLKPSQGPPNQSVANNYSPRIPDSRDGWKNATQKTGPSQKEDAGPQMPHKQSAQSSEQLQTPPKAHSTPRTSLTLHQQQQQLHFEQMQHQHQIYRHQQDVLMRQTRPSRPVQQSQALPQDPLVLNHNPFAQFNLRPIGAHPLIQHQQQQHQQQQQQHQQLQQQQHQQHRLQLQNQKTNQLSSPQQPEQPSSDQNITNPPLPSPISNRETSLIDSVVETSIRNQYSRSFSQTSDEPSSPIDYKMNLTLQNTQQNSQHRENPQVPSSKSVPEKEREAKLLHGQSDPPESPENESPSSPVDSKMSLIIQRHLQQRQAQHNAQQKQQSPAGLDLSVQAPNSFLHSQGPERESSPVDSKMSLVLQRQSMMRQAQNELLKTKPLLPVESGSESPNQSSPQPPQSSSSSSVSQPEMSSSPVDSKMSLIIQRHLMKNTSKAPQPNNVNNLPQRISTESPSNSRSSPVDSKMSIILQRHLNQKQNQIEPTVNPQSTRPQYQKPPQGPFQSRESIKTGQESLPFSTHQPDQSIDSKANVFLNIKRNLSQEMDYDESHYDEEEEEDYSEDDEMSPGKQRDVKPCLKELQQKLLSQKKNVKSTIAEPLTTSVASISHPSSSALGVEMAVAGTTQADSLNALSPVRAQVVSSILSSTTSSSYIPSVPSPSITTMASTTVVSLTFATSPISSTLTSSFSMLASSSVRTNVDDSQSGNMNITLGMSNSLLELISVKRELSSCEDDQLGEEEEEDDNEDSFEHSGPEEMTKPSIEEIKQNMKAYSTFGKQSFPCISTTTAQINVSSSSSSSSSSWLIPITSTSITTFTPHFTSPLVTPKAMDADKTSGLIGSISPAKKPKADSPLIDSLMMRDKVAPPAPLPPTSSAATSSSTSLLQNQSDNLITKSKTKDWSPQLQQGVQIHCEKPVTTNENYSLSSHQKTIPESDENIESASASSNQSTSPSFSLSSSTSSERNIIQTSAEGFTDSSPRDDNNDINKALTALPSDPVNPESTNDLDPSPVNQMSRTDSHDTSTQPSSNTFENDYQTCKVLDKEFHSDTSGNPPSEICVNSHGPQEKSRQDHVKSSVPADADKVPDQTVILSGDHHEVGNFNLIDGNSSPLPSSSGMNQQTDSLHSVIKDSASASRFVSTCETHTESMSGIVTQNIQHSQNPHKTPSDCSNSSHSVGVRETDVESVVNDVCKSATHCEAHKVGDLDSVNEFVSPCTDKAVSESVCESVPPCKDKKSVSEPVTPWKDSVDISESVTDNKDASEINTEGVTSCKHNEGVSESVCESVTPCKHNEGVSESVTPCKDIECLSENATESVMSCEAHKKNELVRIIQRVPLNRYDIEDVLENADKTVQPCKDQMKGESESVCKSVPPCGDRTASESGRTSQTHSTCNEREWEGSSMSSPPQSGNDKRVELVSSATNDVELVSNATRDVELVSNATRDVELVSYATRDVELVSKATRDVELVSYATRDVELVSNAARDVELVSNATRDVELLSNATCDVLSGSAWMPASGEVEGESKITVGEICNKSVTLDIADGVDSDNSKVVKEFVGVKKSANKICDKDNDDGGGGGGDENRLDSKDNDIEDSQGLLKENRAVELVDVDERDGNSFEKNGEDGRENGGVDPMDVGNDDGNCGNSSGKFVLEASAVIPVEKGDGFSKDNVKGGNEIVLHDPMDVANAGCSDSSLKEMGVEEPLVGVGLAHKGCGDYREYNAMVVEHDDNNDDGGGSNTFFSKTLKEVGIEEQAKVDGCLNKEGNDTIKNSGPVDVVSSSSGRDCGDGSSVTVEEAVGVELTTQSSGLGDIEASDDEKKSRENRLDGTLDHVEKARGHLALKETGTGESIVVEHADDKDGDKQNKSMCENNVCADEGGSVVSVMTSAGKEETKLITNLAKLNIDQTAGDGGNSNSDMAVIVVNDIVSSKSCDTEVHGKDIGMSLDNHNLSGTVLVGAGGDSDIEIIDDDDDVLIGCDGGQSFSRANQNFNTKEDLSSVKAIKTSTNNNILSTLLSTNSAASHNKANVCFVRGIGYNESATVVGKQIRNSASSELTNIQNADVVEVIDDDEDDNNAKTTKSVTGTKHINSSNTQNTNCASEMTSLARATNSLVEEKDKISIHDLKINSKRKSSLLVDGGSLNRDQNLPNFLHIDTSQGHIVEIIDDEDNGNDNRTSVTTTTASQNKTKNLSSKFRSEKEKVNSSESNSNNVVEILSSDEEEDGRGRKVQEEDTSSKVGDASSVATTGDHAVPSSRLSRIFSNASDDGVSSRSSHSPLSSPSGSGGVVSRCIQSLGTWSKQQVSNWLATNKLDKICLNLTNLDGPGLQRMAFEYHRNPEVFYVRVKKSLGLTLFQTLVIERSLKALIYSMATDN